MGISYVPHKLHVRGGQDAKLKNAIQHQLGTKITIIPSHCENSHTLLLTPAQILKVENARMNKKKQVTLTFSLRQVKHNIVHKGGFLAALMELLPMLASKILPSILGGAAQGLLSGGIEKLITGSGLNGHYSNDNLAGQNVNMGSYPDLLSRTGDGLFLYRQGRCIKYNLGKNHELIPIVHEHIFKDPVLRKDGVYLIKDGHITDGSGLLLGPNSPFKNIPILGALL